MYNLYLIFRHPIQRKGTGVSLLLGIVMASHTHSPHSVIRAENVVKRYVMGTTEVRAVDGISIDVLQGEFVSIMGPSGSGKTTLLDLLSCLLRPSNGEIFIKNKPISKMDDNELARVRGQTIGFIFQSFNLITRMTAMENVMLPMWFADVPRAEREKRAKKALVDVGLSDRLNHKPNELSGGQRQRVAIARALAINPEIIVADEPTGNLDSVSGKLILETIESLHRDQGKTIIMVTHDASIGARAERELFLQDGKILEEKRNRR